MRLVIRGDVHSWTLVVESGILGMKKVGVKAIESEF